MTTQRLTRADVQKITGFSRSTIERATARYRQTKGREGLRAEQHMPRAPRRFRQADVDAWLNQTPGRSAAR